MNLHGIDIQSDLLTFEKQIKDKFGDAFFDQVEIFFERAVYFAQNEMPLNAISEATFALDLSRFANYNPNIIYLIGFLTEICLEINDINKAIKYCNLGFALLNKEDTDYEEDLRLFKELREQISGEEWKNCEESE